LVTQYEKESKWEEAKRVCEKAHAIDPSAPFVAAELAYLYLEHGGDVNLAVSLAQTAKQRVPDSPITADALGWAYYKLGSPDSAIKELKTATRYVPENPVYQYHLGMAYIASGNFDLAKRTLENTLKSAPNFLYATNAVAALNRLLKKTEAAQ
jgi:tetratricopeptide (TPR) repeat protein